jgi:hypothetical protein
VAKSSNGAIVAIGAMGSDSNRGHARIFKWNDSKSTWDQDGDNIDAEKTVIFLVGQFPCHPLGDFVAIAGAPKNNLDSGESAGHVRN